MTLLRTGRSEPSAARHPLRRTANAPTAIVKKN
jgi:hypothetical protein